MLALLFAAPALADTTHFGYDPNGAPSTYTQLAGSYAGGGKHQTLRCYYAQSGDTLTEINVQGRRIKVGGNDSVRVFLYTTDFWLPDLLTEMAPKDSVLSGYHTFTALSTADTISRTISYALTPGRWYSLVVYPSANDSVEIGRSATTPTGGYSVNGSATIASPYPFTAYTSVEFSVWGVVTHSATSGARGKVTFVAERDTLISSPTASNIVLSTPAGVQTGEFLLAYFVKGDDQFGSGFTAPANQGWIKLWESYNTTEDDQAWGLFWKIVKDAASEPATHTFTWATDAEERSGGIMAFRGVDPSNPFDCRPAIRVRNNVSGGDPITQSVTTRTDSCMVVSMMTGSTISGNAITQPAGMTMAWNRQPGTGADLCASAAAYAIQNAKGASGTKDWTTDGGATAEWSELTVALRPSIKQVGQVH